MKLVSFRVQSEPYHNDRTGAMISAFGSEFVVDLNASYRAYLRNELKEQNAEEIANTRVPKSMLGLLDGGKESLGNAMKGLTYAMDVGNEASVNSTKDGQGKLVYKLDAVKILAPIPFPRLIMDFQSFETHVSNFAKKTGGRIPNEWYEMPACYKKSPSCVVGNNAQIIRPHYTNQLDYELELAIYIGKTCKNVPRDSALEYVAGYSIFNDFSARDIQLREMKIGLGPFKGKDFDTAAAFGPWIVTTDEIENPQDLGMSSRINGKSICQSNTSEMRWPIEKLVEYASMECTLYPGYILGSGTAGFGSGFENDSFLESGDLVELEIDRIGTLTNRVA